MAAQVEVQTGEVGRTGAAGRLHLSPLTDSSNKNVMEMPSVSEPHIMASESSKPAPSPKPRLTPKPFAVEKPTIKPILAPKPQTKPRPETTRLTGPKPDLPNAPKPTVRQTTSNPSRPTATSFRAPNKLKTGQTTKPVPQPFKPAPPLDPGEPSRSGRPVPTGRQKPAASSLAYSKSLKMYSAAEWSGTTSNKPDSGPISEGSITRAKSMDFLAAIGQDKEEKEKDQLGAAVQMRTKPRTPRPRPVSAIFPAAPAKTEAPVPAPRSAARRPLSADLTSKFESIGLPRNSPKANTPTEPVAPLDPEDRTTPSTALGSTDGPAEPANTDQDSRKLEDSAVKEAEEVKPATSIRSRISLLLDSSSSPGATADPPSSVQPLPESEPLVGVKQLIKQLTEDTTPPPVPAVKPVLKPRPLPLDLTKRFSSERSPEPASLTEAADRHEISRDPQRGVEESKSSPSVQKMFVDLKDSPSESREVFIPEGWEAGQLLTPSKESGSGAEFHTVRASLFENVVERQSVLMMDQDGAASSPRDHPAGTRGNDDDGSLVTATYREPSSPSDPFWVSHAFDTVQAAEHSQAMSESVPAAQWEDKAMTLRSRRSERSRPGLPMTPPVPADPPPRYLRVGALQRWTDTGLDQRGGPDRGMLEESESEGRVALERDQDEVAAAPKRLKMLQAEEQQKPRATYFALTGQMQEISPGGATTVEGAQLYNEPSVRSSLSSFPARRNPSLELAFEQEKFDELMLRSHVQSVDVRSPTDKAAKEETSKKQEHEKETERHRAKVNQQAQADFERMRELDRQREYERQRQKAFEKEKRELEEEQQRQKQLELEKQKLQELERQRERREVERQKEMEAEKSRQMALEQEMLRMKELEKRTKLKEMELEKQRQREKERMQEMERLQLENERLRREQEQERKRKEEQERKRKEEQERLREMERQQIIELEKQRSKERAEKEAEKLRQMVLEQEMLKMKELEKERAKEREREMERQMEIRMEKERELEKQRQRQLDLERQQLEKERLRREQEQDRKRKEEQDRKRKEEQEKLKEMERQQIVELERQRLREKEEKEAEKLRQMALEQEMLKIKELEKERAKQREMEMREQEKRRQREMERQRQLDLERQQFENERLRKEQERLREMELEKRKAKEKLEKAEAEKMRHIAKQQEAERQRLKEKQKKEEEEKLRLESSNQRHRGDPASSQSGDPSPRWREPHKPAGLNIDSFTSPTPPGFPAHEAWLQPTPERDGSWKVPPQTSSPVWTTSPQDPWELRPVEMSVDGPRNAPHTLSPEQPQRHRPAFLDQPLLLAPPSGKEPQSYQEPPHGGDQAWIPREPHPPKDRSRRRTQGSQELSRMRSRSMCRRSAPASSTAEGSLFRMRSRSAHREQDLPGLVQQKQSGESDRRDSGTPVRDADSQYGTWDTGLRTDDSLTPATPSSESTPSASPRKHTPLPSPGPQASAPDGHSSSSEVQPLDFPDAPMVLLDNSALRSRAQLGKKRAPRTRPSKAPPAQADEGKPEDWLYRDSTEAKAESRNDDSESEEPSKGADGATVLPQQPQRVALFPGMDASALKAQLKKRGESDNQTDGPAPPPSHPARSPRSPFLPRAARVLPPAGGKENGEEDSPQWLKELKSKKRLSHYESES